MSPLPKIRHPFTPQQRVAFEVWVTGLQAAWLLAESHSVFSHRVLGMAGLAPQGRDEMSRMVVEKSTAFTASGLAGMTLAMAGSRPDEVMRAMMHPIRGTTARNLRRLSRLRQTESNKRSKSRAKMVAQMRHGDVSA
ncbi:hypothetical protein [Vannielia sp.]|uniref:hypothetical protein n=1 Tax=Vannielia sp. TaxID=2813045 RepID=UPI00260DC240|nr:hypothetical protein [Vannielia sp.]MDF1872122.1 hypothetical protein [Vannielia sp.]